MSELSSPAERLVRLATAATYGGEDPYLPRLRALLEEEPALAVADRWCALVCGEWEVVARALAEDPAFPGTRGGPREREPLLYTSFSRAHRLSPEHAAGLLRCARGLLDAGADPDVSFTLEGYEDSPLRPLYGACGVANFPAMAALLIDRGATIDDGESLYHSVEQPDTECLRLLLERGADPTGTNALMRALDFPGTERLRILLEAGADPNETVGAHGAALHRALAKGREVEVLELLAEHGADLGAWREDGRSPWQVAVLFGRRESATWLAARGVEQDEGALERLCGACAAGDEAAAQEVVAQNPGLFDRLEEGEHAAFRELAAEGRTDMIRGLARAGWPVDGPGPGGETALHQAAWFGQAETARALVKAGAGLEVVEATYGCTPLGWAAHGSVFAPESGGDHVATVRALLDAGADIAVKNRWGEPLTGLAREREDVVELLLEHGAPPHPDAP